MKLLFICTHNRCRSILAEAIANDFSDGALQAFSAGSSPQEKVHPLSLHYLRHQGISIDGLKSQSWDEFEDLEPDAILTLCDNAAEEVCPVWFDRTVQVHWGLEDPSKEIECEERQSSKFMETMGVLSHRLGVLAEPENIRLRGAALEALLTEIANSDR